VSREVRPYGAGVTTNEPVKPERGAWTPGQPLTDGQRRALAAARPYWPAVLEARKQRAAAAAAEQQDQ